VATETEVKFPVEDFEPVRQRLEQLRAEPLGTFLQDDRFYDFPDRRLLHGDCGLRVRTVTSSASDVSGLRHLLTYKGPRESGPAKRRLEIELAVSDPQAAAELLEQLGLQQILRLQKRRQRYRLNDCRVELDELPVLGKFVEIEGPDLPAIARAA